MKGNRSGFTLIELVVVVGILGILSAIAAPRFISSFRNGQVVADLVTVRTLNGITPIARMSLNDGDPFQDENQSSEDLLSFLVDRGYLVKIPEPQTSNAEFFWTLYDEKWVLLVEDAFYTISLSEGIRFGNSGWSSSFISGEYSGGARNLILPTTIDGTVITRIWQDVFKDKNLLSISFEEGSQIEHIHARAFRNNQLTEVVLPQGLKRIDTLAFDGNFITSVTIPDSVETIESNAFTGIERITVGGNLNFSTHPQGNHSILENAINNSNAFRDTYLSEVGGAGTYLWDGENWTKE